MLLSPDDTLSFLSIDNVFGGMNPSADDGTVQKQPSGSAYSVQPRSPQVQVKKNNDATGGVNFSSADTRMPAVNSLKSMREAIARGESQQSQEGMSKKLRNEKFSLEKFTDVWLSYMREIPERIVLSQTIRSAVLSMEEENKVTVKVCNSYEEKDLNDEMGRLKAYISDKIENDVFSIKIEVDNNMEIVRSKTDRGRFEEEKKTNPIVKLLADSLGLEVM